MYRDIITREKRKENWMNANGDWKEVPWRGCLSDFMTYRSIVATNLGQSNFIETKNDKYTLMSELKIYLQLIEI